MAATKKLSLAVNVAGIRPDAAAPYLRRADVESTLVDGSFSAQLGAGASVAADKSLSAYLNINNVELSDQGKSLMSMPTVIIGGQVKWVQVASTLEPQFLLKERSRSNVGGPDMTIRRDADLRQALRGRSWFRLLPRKLRPGEPAAKEPDDGAADLAAAGDRGRLFPVFRLPSFSAGRFRHVYHGTYPV